MEKVVQEKSEMVEDKRKRMKTIQKCFVVCMLVLSLMAGLGCFLNGDEWSRAERRKLRTFPAIGMKEILSGGFQSALEEWMEDRLWNREGLLLFHSWVNLHVLMNTMDGELVEENGSIISLEKELDKNSVAWAASIFRKIYEQNLENTECKIYLSIVPDKSYFLQNKNALVMDYTELLSEMIGSMDFASYINIIDHLELDNYYSTDPHLSQDSLAETAIGLAKGMNIKIDTSFRKGILSEDFQGLYARRTALKHNSDTLAVLNLEQMKDWVVTTYRNGKPEIVPVYESEALTHQDPYDVFLGGNAGLITIENPHGDPDRELVVFRDSFGSSIVPLIASGYSKITLIDLRALPSAVVKDKVNFTDQDVLFLYSTGVLNSSFSLK